MNTLAAWSFRTLRNLIIASIIALLIALAPVVRSDAVHFFKTVFAGSNPTAVVSADVTK
jgi:hypothetical protein